MFLRTIILVTFCFTLKTFALDDKDKAIITAKRAIELMNKGEFQESIDSLNVCIDLDDKNINYKYEKALAYTRLKRFQKSIDILTPLINEKDANDKFYQLLGNSYDNLSSRKAAFQVYKDGLQKFPSSGRLYQELGLNKLNDTNFKAAIDYWKQGIKANPEFGNNYYLIVINTQTKDSLLSLGSLLIAEEYINVSANPKRSKEISQLLINTFNKFFSYTNEEFDRYKKNSEFIMSDDREFINSFSIIIKNNVLGKRSNNKSFSYDYYTCKENILNEWNKKELNIKFQRKILEYFDLMRKNQVFEAYNFLLFNDQFPKEVNTWREKNIDKVKDFTSWLPKNIYSVFVKE